MTFFSNFNMSNFTYPNFDINFGNWTLPSFNWNTQNWSSLNVSTFYNNQPNTNYPPVIGDTFTYTNTTYANYQPKFNYNFDFNPIGTQTYINIPTIPDFTTKFDYGSTIKNKKTSTSKNYTGLLKDYNEKKGKKLAQTALNNSTGWSGYCARSVKTAIENVGLGDYTSGHAYQMKKILDNNPNFKKLSNNNIDVNKLPAGCILVYDRGEQGYSKEYGHVEITTGDGRGVSDGITQNLRKPTTVFIPV